MSTFGGPGGRQIIAKPIPPERGSFPLDHDAECQPLMKQYLRCLRSHRGVNDDECRQLSKGYLQCRMERYDNPSTGNGVDSADMADDRNLMAPDSMKNLGYGDEAKDDNAIAANTGDEKKTMAQISGERADAAIAKGK